MYTSKSCKFQLDVQLDYLWGSKERNYAASWKIIQMLTLSL
jgi:hypothetical protein